MRKLKVNFLQRVIFFYSAQVKENLKMLIKDKKMK